VAASAEFDADRRKVKVVFTAKGLEAPMADAASATTTKTMLTLRKITRLRAVW